MHNYVCTNCKHSWYQKKADKCPNCGSKNILVELPEEEGPFF